MRAFLHTVRRVIGLALFLIILLLLIRFGLQFHHPAKWDSLGLVAELKKQGDPLLKDAGSWLDLPWPSRSARWLPVWLATGVLIVWMVVSAIFYRAIEFVEKVARVPRHAPALPHPIPALPETQQRAPLAAAPAVTTPKVGEEAVARPNSETEPTVAVKKSIPLEPAATERTAPTRKMVERMGKYEILRIGRYEILQELGRGAMGVVYKARDTQLGRLVAIKSILAGNISDAEFAEYKERFYREARAAGQMSHPGIVAIYDISEDETGQPCMVMEYIDGTTLATVAATERLPLEQSLEIAIQVAEGLDYAHTHGVIHRDIKPANILVTRNGKAKITDFGIAKLEGTHLTRTGQILGTPAFMSPEQFLGAAVDSRTDIFSLGSVMYWMYTGEKPFPGDTMTSVAFKVVQTTPVPAHQLNPGLPAGLDVVISRCLAKDPEQRYRTGRQLSLDLQKFRADRRGSATRPLPSEKTDTPISE